MRLILLGLALLCSSAANAQRMTAQPASTNPVHQPDPAAVEAANRLLTAMDYDRMMERMTDSMAGQMAPSLKKAIEEEVGGSVDDELIRRLTDVQTAYLRKVLVNDPNLRRALAIIYARHFSTTELDRLTTLYAEPVMKKWAEVMPDLMGDMMPLILDVTNGHRDELRKETIEVVEDYYEQKSGGS